MDTFEYLNEYLRVSLSTTLHVLCQFYETFFYLKFKCLFLCGGGGGNKYEHMFE